MVPVTQLPSHLPDLCLENVFKRVPLRDLLRSVRVVCTNWRRVVPTELKRRRELVLVRDFDHAMETVREDENPFGSDLMEHVRREDRSQWVRLRSLDLIRFNALLLRRGLAETFATPLLDTAPNITHLTVMQCNISEGSEISVVVQLVRLLNHYRDRLVSLKLDILFSFYETEVTRAEIVTNCTALFATINQLQSLRHLTLNFQFPRVNFLPKLSILSRLDTFVSICVDETWMLDSIRQHATAGRVRIDWTLDLLLEEMLGLNQQLPPRFTSVDVANVLTVTDYENLRLFGARFLSISRLTVHIGTMQMTMLARCLSPLTQLVHLKVSALKIPEDEQPQADYVQVPSVRLLSLEFSPHSHLDTSRLHLSQIFPNLQVLSLDQHIHSCDLCEYDVDVWDEDEDPEVIRARVEHCIRLSRQPFGRCAHLHTIKHYGRAYPLQDLFPRDLITRDQF